MKAVLISIQPKWCELIASRKKVVEVRKTRPKIDVPFKCYIFCTANKLGAKDLLEIHGTDGKIRKANGKVIGEFVCDSIEHYTSNCTVFESVLLPSPSELEEMCLTLTEFNSYGTRGKLLYGWHISDLVIYDEPKELSEFRHCGANYHFNPKITRPPQSWCYAEELRKEDEGK